MSAPTRLPVEDDPFNFARYADPYPNYRRVRETTPVYWSQLLGGWVLTRHADVKAALLDKRLSAARARDAQAAQLSEDLRRQLAPVDELLRRWALFQDNPEHPRIRHALTGAFTSSVMRQLRQRVEEIADGLIDAARGRGEMDLVADFALRLPAMVIAELLGMSSSDSERFQGWVHTIALYFAIGSLGNVETIAALRETVEQMADYMRAIVDDHRRTPKDDLIGSLIGAGSQGEPLSEVEILSQCMLLLHGGYESTMNTISSGMHHILRDPDQRRLCAEDPGLAGPAVEEALRYEPAFQFVVRAATADLDAGGQAIEAGQQVVCVLAAANRDPALFADPERFDIQRHPNRVWPALLHRCGAGPDGVPDRLQHASAPPVRSPIGERHAPMAASFWRALAGDPARDFFQCGGLTLTAATVVHAAPQNLLPRSHRPQMKTCTLQRPGR